MLNEEPKQNKEQKIEALCQTWLSLKAREGQAKEGRLAIEKALTDLIAFDQVEGSKTFKHGMFKVALKAGINYKLDKEIWEKIFTQIPDGLRPVKTKLEVDATGARYLKNNEPEIWAIAAQAITSTPAKIEVKVELDQTAQRMAVINVEQILQEAV